MIVFTFILIKMVTVRVVFTVALFVSASNIFCQNHSLSNTTPMNKAAINDTNIEGDEESSESETSETVSWDTYINTLRIVLLNQLETITTNIKYTYNLNSTEIEDIDKAFNVSASEFEYLLQNKLKKTVEGNTFNNSEKFMLDFMDTSMLVLEEVVAYSLEKVKSALSKPTSFPHQTMKHKIFRHQSKMARALVEMQICHLVAICKDRNSYTDYIVDWLRYVLIEKDHFVNKFFNAVPAVLDRYAGFVKTSLQFRKHITHASKMEASAQRDVIDLIDETLTNEHVLREIPNELTKIAKLLIDLFNALNESYEINDDNTEELESVSYMFINSDADASDVKEILDAILKNMQSNFKTFSKEKQTKMRNIWSKIILL